MFNNKITKLSILILGVLGILFNDTSCKKEYSYEGSRKGTPSDSVFCGNTLIEGLYAANFDFTDSNYVICNVFLSQSGTYKAYTDTVNGFYFADTSRNITAGHYAIRLNAYGRMNASEETNFTLHFNQLKCSFVIQPAKALYSFVKEENNCKDSKLFGSYKAGQSLVTGDSLQVQVDVISPGLFALQTEVINGISFSASGVFVAKGWQVISLVGKGTPITGGSFEYPITAPNSACSFFVQTEYKTPDPSMYYSFDADGKHYVGYLDSATKSKMTTSSGIVDILSFGTLISSSVDTVFTSNLSRIDENVVVGTYHSAIVSDEDYACGINFSDKQGPIYYSSNSLPTFQIKLLSCDKPGEIVKGEFSGPVLNDKGKVVSVADGIFHTYLSH